MPPTMRDPEKAAHPYTSNIAERSALSRAGQGVRMIKNPQAMLRCFKAVLECTDQRSSKPRDGNAILRQNTHPDGPTSVLLAPQPSPVILSP